MTIIWITFLAHDLCKLNSVAAFSCIRLQIETAQENIVSDAICLAPLKNILALQS